MSESSDSLSPFLFLSPLTFFSPVLPVSRPRKGRVVVEVESLALVLVESAATAFGGRPLPRFDDLGGGGNVCEIDFVSSVGVGGGLILVFVGAGAGSGFFFVVGEILELGFFLLSPEVFFAGVGSGVMSIEL